MKAMPSDAGPKNLVTCYGMPTEVLSAPDCMVLAAGRLEQAIRPVAVDLLIAQADRTPGRLVGMIGTVAERSSDGAIEGAFPHMPEPSQVIWPRGLLRRVRR